MVRSKTPVSYYNHSHTHVFQFKAEGKWFLRPLQSKLDGAAQRGQSFCVFLNNNLNIYK